MQATSPLNLMDVDLLVKQFIQEREQGIATLHRVYFKNNDQLSLRALKEEIIEELRTGCVTFLNKNYPMDELGDYLFYIVNAYCKKTAQPIVKQKIEYVCPGCVFLGKKHLVLNFDEIFKCDECYSELKDTAAPQRERLLQAFARHNKNGYR